MRRKRPQQGQFVLMNARRERSIAGLRREMIEAAMAGGKSGFAVQIQMGDGYEAPLRPAPRRER